MYKKLKIDPTFQNLIAPLSEDEYNQLEENILAAQECRDTIKVWRGYIIDGHNRYTICKKHKIPYRVEKMRFASKSATKLWIAENQLGRRNLTKAMKIELARTKAEILCETAKANGEPYNLRKKTAELANVGDRTVHKYMQIVKCGTDELVSSVKNGSININSAYNALKVNTREVEVLYDDNDMFFRNTAVCCANVVGRINGICRLYGFLMGDGLVGLAGCEMQDVKEMTKSLDTQVEILNGLRESMSNN